MGTHKNDVAGGAVGTIRGKSTADFEDMRNKVTSNTLSGSSSQKKGYRSSYMHDENKALIALMLGIIAAVFSILYSWAGLLCGIAGIIMSEISRKRGQSSMATLGLSLSVIGIVLSVTILIIGGLSLIAP